MKPTINPQTLRVALRLASFCVGVGAVLLGMYEKGQLNWQSALMAILTAAAGWLQGKQEEAPGSVPIWELPVEIRDTLVPPRDS